MLNSFEMFIRERYNVMNVSKITEAANQKLVQRMSSMKVYILPFVILAIIFSLGISSILRANFYYIDDFGRAYAGYTGWEHYSRFLAVYLSNFIHADNYLMDISPLPQLIAVLIMAGAGIMLLHIITGKHSYTVGHFMAVIPLALSPYFLECLSYKYDSPYMALSVFVSVFPFIYSAAGDRKFVIASIVGTISMCMTYQASAGIYPLLALLLGVKGWNSGKKVIESIKFMAVSAGSYIAGLLVFRLFIMEEVDGYSSTEMVSADNFTNTVIDNYTKYINYLLNDYRVEWLLLMACLCLCFIYVSVRYSQKNKWMSLLVISGSVVIMFLLAFGVYPFLSKPGFAPRCMYGIGVFIAVVGICVADSPKVYLGKLAGFLLGWMFFVFSFSYGNALFMQGQYTEYRMELVVDDLVANGFIEKDAKILTRITGSIGYAPAIENAPADYDALRRLVPVTFRDSTWYWGHYGFTRYYDLDNLQVTAQDIPLDEQLPLISDNAFHTIRGNQEFLWIDLH